MKMHLRDKRGFTLIELLVVVAIISLLSSVVLASLNSARVKARNTVRLSGIHTLVNAFNLSLNSSFPVSSWACVSATCYGSWVGYNGATPANAIVDPFLAPNLPQKPIDPSDATRGYGGFLYANTAGPYIGPYDSYSFPQAIYLMWMVEPPINSNSCGKGRIYDANGNYIQCLLKLD